MAKRGLLSGLRKAYACKGDDATLTRFVKVRKPLKRQPRQMVLNLLGHPTIEAKRSLFFRKGVHNPATRPNVLVSGHNNAKIGRDVRKGWLKGYWIYTLTLEERATCPRSCKHWYDCYGNNMPFAKRFRHGPALLTAIANDIQKIISIRGRKGILLRLHALGDFYSVQYVQFWVKMLEQFPTLAIYGYTARQEGTAIGNAIKQARLNYGLRFAIRVSDGKGDSWTTRSVANATAARQVNAILCPEQTEKTLACATCGLCWTTSKPIAFMDH